MGLYIYANPENESETVEVFQKMNDVHKYFQDGKEWRRVFTVPGAVVDSASNIDPFSKKEFVEKTGKKNDTVGSLMDRSKELSMKRVEKEGRDQIKEGFLQKYKKETGKEYRSLDKNQTIKAGPITVDFSK